MSSFDALIYTWYPIILIFALFMLLVLLIRRKDSMSIKFKGLGIDISIQKGSVNTIDQFNKEDKNEYN
jgi:hypothetical protein